MITAKEALNNSRKKPFEEELQSLLAKTSLIIEDESKCKKTETIVIISGISRDVVTKAVEVLEEKGYKVYRYADLLDIKWRE